MNGYRVQNFGGWLLAIFLAIPVAAIAQGQGTGKPDTGAWTLRIDFAFVDPAGDFVSVNPGGATVAMNFDSGAGVGLRAEYRLSPQFGIELGILGAGSVGVATGYAYGWTESDVEVSGFAPLTLGLNFHLTPHSRADFYVGPQLALVNYSSVDVWAGHGFTGTDVSVDNDTGWGIILGLDVPVGEGGWMVQSSLRYIDTDMRNTGGDIAFKSEFDPVIVSVGFGYRF